MEDLKKQHERGVVDRFFDCLKYQDGPSFSFLRAGEAPDFVYGNGKDELQVEITQARFDERQLEFIWRSVRGGPKNRELCLLGVGNQDEALANSIVERAQEKCLKKRYGEKTILLIEVPPGHTTIEDLKKLLVEKVFPPVIPYLGVYVTGRFPIQTRGDDVYSLGGYHVHAIKETWPLRKADEQYEY